MNEVDPIRDPEDIEKMKEYLKEKSPRDYLMFVLGINSALRISDLLSLQIKHVMELGGELKEKIHIREQKTNKEKKYRMSDSAKDAIRYYIDNINWKKYHGHWDIRPSDYLFASNREGHDPIDRTWAWRVISDTADAVGIDENIGTHSLRKTWGYQARVNFGLDISIIMEKLNHDNPKTTKRYIGVLQKEVEEAETKVSL